MEYKELFKKLGNPNPICLADYTIKITADDIPKYNNKYDITFVPNIKHKKHIIKFKNTPPNPMAYSRLHMSIV